MISRMMHGFWREVGLFLIAFLPLKNIEPVDEEVDSPEKDRYSSLVSFLSLALFVGIFMLAYGLYADQQTLTPAELLRNLVPKDTMPQALLASFFESMFYNAVFLGVAFVGFGLVLGVRIRYILGTIRLAVYNAVALLAYLWAVMHIFNGPDGGWKILGVLTIGVLFFFEVIAVVIIFHILIKRRMGADGYYQPLMPLLEAALGARALSIALRGNATIVNVPVPHWVVAYGPSLLVMIGFCAKAAWVQREYIKNEDRDTWHALSHNKRSRLNRAKFRARVQLQHWLRFAACLLLMAVGVVVSATYK